MAAVIVPAPGNAPTADELTAFVKTRLASHKTPQHYHFVAELPRNELGKLLKTELRAVYGKPPAE